MAEGQDNEGNAGQRETESNGLLADKLFSKVFAKNAEEHLEKAKTDLARGATDQASEHLKRVGMSLAQSLTNMTSSRLSDTENEEWLRLQKRKYNVDKDGMIWSNFLDEHAEDRIRFLDRKAFGQDKQE
jgi:hypothetical protein